MFVFSHFNHDSCTYSEIFEYFEMPFCVALWLEVVGGNSSVLSFCVCFQDKEPRGIIPLENLSIREVDEPRKPVRSSTLILSKFTQITWILWRWKRSFCSLRCAIFPLSCQNCFELYNPNHKGQVIKACKTEADGRVVEGNHVVYRISAPTPEEKEEWIKSIK